MIIDRNNPYEAKWQPIKSCSTNICPNCKSIMRDIECLMMGPKWHCEKCDNRYWKIRIFF